MKKMIILGCGGHARSMLDTVETKGEYEIAGFVGKDRVEKFSYRGYQMVGTDADLEQLYSGETQYACIGIGYMGKGNLRNELYGRIKKTGFLLPPIIDKTSVVAKDILPGEGSFIGKRAVVNADAVVGKMTIINTGAIIEHNCMVGDFSHIAVAAVLCGGVEIGRGCLVGANAVIRQGVRIGDYAIVGAGAVVIQNVPAGAVVMGVPAEKI